MTTTDPLATSDAQAQVAPPPPTLAEAFWTWSRIAALSFGGPAGQIALMNRILVDEKRWLGERRFLHALNFCMLLPGPEAQQLAIYIGWLLNKTWGGIVAGVLFVLPGALAIMALSMVYAVHGEVGWVAAAFFGLKAAVLAIVLQAVVRIGQKALGNAPRLSLAAAAFVLIFAIGAPFPLIILAAAILGWIGGRSGWRAFAPGDGPGDAGEAADGAGTVLGSAVPAHAKPQPGRTRRFVLTIGALWLGPTALLVLILGPSHVFSQIAIFFSQMAVVTFGGAYAVLAYVAQAAVETHGWLRPGEMLDGLGMAETTPGPLIMVVQFVGFLGAMREAGGLDPLVAGALGGLLTTWVTFAPCFLWIFVGAPHAERLRGNKALAGALGAITAAVVGVILNLAIWFGIHVVFREVGEIGALPVPVLSSLDPAAALLAAAALIAAFRFKLGAVPLLLAAALAGVGLYLAS